MRRRAVVITRNFERNLDELVAFRLIPSEALIASFEQVDELPRQLRRLPDQGRLMQSPPKKLAPLLNKIVERLGGGVLREYVAGELLVGYLSGPKAVTLLAVRHHKQHEYVFT